MSGSSDVATGDKSGGEGVIQPTNSRARNQAAVVCAAAIVVIFEVCSGSCDSQTIKNGNLHRQAAQMHGRARIAGVCEINGPCFSQQGAFDTRAEIIFLFVVQIVEWERIIVSE